MTEVIREAYRRGAFYTEVADELLAAGFGDVTKAKAQALREAAHAPIPRHLLGTGQPNVRHWLNGLADAIEAGR